MASKKETIKRINALSFGDILYGYKNGKLINVNAYDEKSDTFNTYGDDCVCHATKFEELPQKLMRA